MFLGSQDASLVPTIEGAVSQAASDSQPFSLRIASPGSFGGRRSLRVIWVGVQDQPTGSLGQLHAAVSAQLQAAKINFDASPFRAHITLGRARRDAIASQSEAMHNAIARRAGDADRRPVVEAIHCQELTLVRSDLRPTGPIYTPLRHARLASADA